MTPTEDNGSDSFFSTYRNDSYPIWRNTSDGFDDVNSTFFSMYDDILLDDMESTHNIGLAVLLATFCVATVFGNGLIIVAVARERYLHSVTNYFITSLAVADFLVGLVVMPFQAIFEFMDKRWIFGESWCDLWHSLDVLASTSSILNLCVISLDRYWAITDPFTYPSRMTTSRACVLIALVWICSSLISFPAILWWRATRSMPIPDLKCPFTQDIGYLVFSSIISFYGPLFVMVFTYYRIYRAAAQQTKSLKLGTKLCTDGDIELTLRIHRGGRKAVNQLPQSENASGRSNASITCPHHHHHHHPSTQPTHHGGNAASAGGCMIMRHHHHHHHHNSGESDNDVSVLSSAHGTSSVVNNANMTNSSGAGAPVGTIAGTPGVCTGIGACTANVGPNSGTNRTNNSVRVVPKNLKHFSISRKLAKFAKEKKAAKTLGIVMGVFILCWFPFFVVNLISGFCSSCLQHAALVTDIVTWLGWINSSMNPFIYACMSKEMRR